MEWTQEAPTKPGWYWYWSPEWDSDAPLSVLEVIWHNAEGGRLDAWDSDEGRNVETYSGYWLGPIEEPQRPAVG